MITVTAAARVPITAVPAGPEVWDFLANNDAPFPMIDGEPADLDQAWMDSGALYVTDTEGRVWLYQVLGKRPVA